VTEYTPAPWNLTGNGYILLYQLPRSFAAASSPYGIYKGGFGAVMLVDYRTSNVGPYRELLFIPGRVAYPEKTGYSISKIYVSTLPSVISGQVNWGIPKELASFEWRSTEAGDRVQVCKEGNSQPFFEIEMKPFGLRFPMTAAVLPPLVQYRDHKTYITRLQSRAWGQLAKIKDLRVSSSAFPAIDRYKPLMAIKVSNFRMVFPVPEIMPHDGSSNI
jgi:hypothetical protein